MLKKEIEMEQSKLFKTAHKEIAPTAINDSVSITETEDQVTAHAEKLSKGSSGCNTTSTTPGRVITRIEQQMLLSDIGSEKSAETIRSDAVTAIKRFEETDWSTVNYTETGSLKKRDNIGRMIKVRGTINDLLDPQPRYLTSNGDENLFDTTQFTLLDSRGESIDSTTIVGQEFHAQLQKLRSSGRPVEVLGTVIPIQLTTPLGKVKGHVYRLLPFKVEASDDPVQIIQTGNQEMKTAEALVDKLKGKSGRIIGYIKKQLIEQIGIKGLEDARELDGCLDFVILQALSDGYQSERSLSLKLHSLVIGSPGVGKKLLSQSARMLNPVHTEGHAAKLTVAGISGTSVYKNQSWHSTPGLIPLAHRGVFIVQDFHAVPKKRDIMGVLSMVMEDGRVIDSTSARATHPALTAIHLDMNRQAQLYSRRSGGDSVTKPVNTIDLGIAMNVLTRFDFIAEIPRDVERQMEVALSMQTGLIKSCSVAEEFAKEDQARELAALIAFLRTTFAEIEIPAKVSSMIAKKQRELLDMNRERLPELEILGDFQTRLSNSIVKMVFAITRANARRTATKADVDMAFHFARIKLDFLAQMESFETPDDWDRTKVSKKIQSRRNKIVYTFSGQEVTVKQVHAVLSKGGSGLTELTIRRDLDEVGTKVRHGVFKVSDQTKSPGSVDAAAPVTM